MHFGAPGLESHTDPALFDDGLPSLILNMEGLHRASPDNHMHTIELAKTYCLYTYGWLEGELETLEARGETDRADALRVRIRKLYLHARDLGLSVMRHRDPDVDEVLDGKPEDLEVYLERRYFGKRATRILFWTAMAWGSAINVGRDQPDLVASLTTVDLLAARAMELDPHYYHSAPLALSGAIKAALPKALGGKPEVAKQLFEEALASTERKNGILLVQYARRYALPAGDRELYETLLREAVELTDAPETLALSNAVARKRAAKYLTRIDDEI